MPPRAPVAPASVMNQRGSVVHLCSGSAKVLRRAPRDRGGRYLAVRRRAAALKGISEEVQLDRRGSAQLVECGRGNRDGKRRKYQRHADSHGRAKKHEQGERADVICLSIDRKSVG